MFVVNHPELLSLMDVSAAPFCTLLSISIQSQPEAATAAEWFSLEAPPHPLLLLLLDPNLGNSPSSTHPTERSCRIKWQLRGFSRWLASALPKPLHHPLNPKYQIPKKHQHAGIQKCRAIFASRVQKEQKYEHSDIIQKPSGCGSSKNHESSVLTVFHFAYFCRSNAFSASCQL